jgi:prepilin peptidase CpaA
MLDVVWPLAITFVAACIAAFTDIRHFRVYNSLTIPLVTTGLVYHGVVDGMDGFANSGMGMVFGFGVLLLPYLLGLMGAGDVKLMAGIGAWLGFGSTVLVFAASALIGGTYAIALILYRGKFKESWCTIKFIFYRFAALGIHLGKQDLVEPLYQSSERRLRLIPFAATVALGMIAVVLWVLWT